MVPGACAAAQPNIREVCTSLCYARVPCAPSYGVVCVDTSTRSARGGRLGRLACSSVQVRGALCGGQNWVPSHEPTLCRPGRPYRLGEAKDGLGYAVCAGHLGDAFVVAAAGHSRAFRPPASLTARIGTCVATLRDFAQMAAPHSWTLQPRSPPPIFLRDWASAQPRSVVIVSSERRS